MSSNTIRLHRVLRAPPERVYRAFLDADAMAKWLPPNGFTCKVHHLDAKVGGTYRMSFTNFTTCLSQAFGGKYLELVPNERIRNTDKFDDPNWRGEMQTTVTLKKVSVGTEANIVQEDVPDAIPPEGCYLGWQDCLSCWLNWSRRRYRSRYSGGLTNASPVLISGGMISPMKTPAQLALEKVRSARSKDEGADAVGELSRIAETNLDEIIELYHSSPEDSMAIVSCLLGRTEQKVFDLYLHALKNEDGYVRWYALKGLACSTDPALIPTFIDALRDRSQLAKSVAIEWLDEHGDARAISELEHLLELPSMIKYSPGTVDQAKEAITAIRARSVQKANTGKASTSHKPSETGTAPGSSAASAKPDAHEKATYTSDPADSRDELEPPPTAKARVSFLLVSTLLGGLGIAALYYANLDYCEARRFARTPPVHGKILTFRSDLDYGRPYVGGKTQYGRVRAVYTRTLTYEYIVDGKRYVGDQISRNYDKFYLSSFPIGPNPDVFYDPSNPANAYLDSTNELGFAHFLTLLGTLLVGWAVVRQFRHRVGFDVFRRSTPA